MKNILMFIATCFFCTSIYASDNTLSVREIYYPETNLLQAKLFYEGEHIRLRRFYSYNESGLLNKIIADNGCSEDPNDLNGLTERHITSLAKNAQAEVIEEYFLDVEKNEEVLIKRIENIFSPEGNLLIQEVINASGFTFHQTFHEEGKQVTLTDGVNNLQFSFDTEEKPADRFLPKGLWEDIASETWGFFRSLAETVSNIGTYLTQHLSYTDYVSSEFEKLSTDLLGRNYLLVAGYYNEPPEFGAYGEKEISDKVRITLSIGILNTRWDNIESLKMVSRAHGGAKIHYVYRPTEGWTWDVIKSSMVKWGHESLQAQQLAAIWKSLIREMGGPSNGGTIIHYAHSIGGTDTAVARELLTPEEQRMIHVTTMGSPTLIPDGGFASVTNYVSKRDFVCYLDPINYAQGLLGSNNVIFIDTLLGVPFVDHPISSDSYTKIFEERGRIFVAKHCGHLTSINP